MDKRWVIKNGDGLYWNNDVGWVEQSTEARFDKEPVTIFSQEEKDNFNLPMGGIWVELT